MASGRLFIPSFMPALDQNGAPLVNARAYFYENLTDVLASIYSDEALTVPLPNPVLANVAGRFPAIWASDAMTYSYSVNADDGPAGIPFTGDGLTVSQGVAILVAAAAEAAADDAAASAVAAAGSADEAEEVLDQIEAIIAGSPDAPSVLNKLNKNGDNQDADFLDNLTFSSTFATAAARPMRQKLMDELAIKDLLDDDGNPIDGLFSVIDDAIDDAIANEAALWLNPDGDYVILREHEYNPIAMVDVPPLPNPSSVGAFAQGFRLTGAGMTTSRLHVRTPSGYAFRLNVTNPVPYAYRAEMGMQFSNFAMIGLGAGTPSGGGIELFNSYQGSVQFIHARNIYGSFIKMVNGLEGNVPDSGWNCVGLQNLWIEGCGVGGNGFGIDATGVEGRNEGSFTHLRHVFIQSCGKNQYFTLTGVSNANPAIMELNLNQMPAVSPTQTAHPFRLGDRVKPFGVKKTTNLVADPLATVAGSFVVTVTLAAHGLAVGDMVNISAATAVGGITVSGDYMITSVPGSGTFTILHSVAATSTASGGGTAPVVLVSPMKAVDDVAFYVGPTVTATTLQLYSASGAALSLVTDPATTTSGSATVSITRAAHGLAPGDPVVLNFLVPFNGVTIDKGYSVVATPDANTFTITVSTLATASGAGGGTVGKLQKIAAFNGAAIGTWVGDLAAPLLIDNNPILTTFGDPNIPATTVVITDTAHGAVVGDLVTIAGAPAVGGITVAGQYRITALGDNAGVNPTNKYRITHSVAATSTVQGGGAAVTAQYTYRATVTGEVGYYEPQSGGMRYKGQLLTLDQCGFTLNQNCAEYIQGGAGGAIGMFHKQVTWENNYRRHFFAKGGINFKFMVNQAHGNNVAGLRQWRLWEFDASEYVIQTVSFEHTKVRAKECPSIAFKYSGSQSSINNISVERTLWSDYDYTGQQRYFGVPFDQITQNLILTYSSTTAMILRPDQFAGGGNKTPLRLRGPNNDSGTGVASTSGEWVEWQLSSNNGLSLSNSGLAASTLYNVYGYDNDGVMALTTSTVTPVNDPLHGYQVLPGDPTMLWVGRAQTDAGGLFTTTQHPFLVPERVTGNQMGTQAYRWYDWLLGRTLYRNGALPTAVTQTTLFQPSLAVATKSHNFGSLAAGATETTTLTTGVTAALGDTVLKAYLSIDQQGITLDAWVSAANTITVLAKNETAGVIDLANATLSAVYFRNT